MRYAEILPADRLRPFIRCFWTMRGTRAALGPCPERVLPDGTTEMVFNLSDPFEHHRDQDAIQRQPPELVVGQLVGPMLIAPTGAIDLVAIRFRPGGARPFLQVPLAELTSRSSEVIDICRPLAETSSALGELRGGAARIRFLERRLLSVLRRDPPVDDRVMAGVQRIERAAGRITVDQLARDLNLSPRQLERRFADAVGLSPKLLCRIIRFQRIFSELDSDRPKTLSSLAQRCGYYDQAHLNRDFRQFSGQSPTVFFAHRNELAKIFAGLET